jgi:hypothetical protein
MLEIPNGFHRHSYPLMIRAATPQLFTAENSFRAYGIASRYQLGEEALYAAQLTLERTMSFDACGEDLRFISGVDLFRLLAYRIQCTRGVRRCINETRDIPLLIIGQCRYGKQHATTTASWWQDHFVSRVYQPSPKWVTNQLAFQSVQASHRTICASCLQPNVNSISSALCAALEAKLNKVIEQVGLKHDLGSASANVYCRSTSMFQHSQLRIRPCALMHSVQLTMDPE